jgi:RNA polymerase sigma-70 factor (ECF subfamily)
MLVEGELRRHIEAGDMTAAWRSLHHAHDRDVERYVRFCAGAGASVDDICQEVWTAVRDALPSFRFMATPRVWLFAIARRKAADAFRKPVPVTLDSDIAAELSAPLLGRTPSRLLHLAERERALEAALAELSPEEREWLELRFVVGLKPAEMVRLLGLDIGPNTLSQRIVRLTRRVRERLEKKPEIDSYRR